MIERLAAHEHQDTALGFGERPVAWSGRVVGTFDELVVLGVLVDAAERGDEVLGGAVPAAGVPAQQTARLSLARRLRAELRRIHRRDYFPPTERDLATAAVEALAMFDAESEKQPS